MHISLGNTTRGLLAATITGDGALVLAAWNGTSSWHVSLGGIFMSLYVLAGALIDPGSKPPKA